MSIFSTQFIGNYGEAIQSSISPPFKRAFILAFGISSRFNIEYQDPRTWFGSKMQVIWVLEEEREKRETNRGV